MSSSSLDLPHPAHITLHQLSFSADSSSPHVAAILRTNLIISKSLGRLLTACYQVVYTFLVMQQESGVGTGVMGM